MDKKGFVERYHDGEQEISYNRTRAQICMDRSEVARILTKGIGNAAEIAKRIQEQRDYPYSVGLCKSDIAALKREWQRAYITDINDLKGQQIARLELLEEAYWDAYERSKSKKVMSETERFEEKMTDSEGENKGAKKGNLTTVRAKKKEMDRDGDPRFLEGVHNVIRTKCKILGLNAPEQIHVKDWRKEAAKAGVNPGEVFNAMVGKFLGAEPEGRSVAGDDAGGSLGGSSEN